MALPIPMPVAPRRPPPRRVAPWRRCRRIVVMCLLLCLVPTTISYVTTTMQPSNSTFAIRSFEWLRDHGAASIAVGVEDIYYSLTAPAQGGPGLRSLPRRSGGARAGALHPPNIPPLIAPALPGEGIWLPSESWTGASPPIQTTQFRSDPSYPRMVAGVSWIDTARTTIALYPGRLEPSVSLPRGPMQVPYSLRGRLLATFNSGFKLQDSGGGGFALGGRIYAPMKPGLATLLHYTDGRVDIRTWSRADQLPAAVDFARQNLPLIVDQGLPNPNLGDGPAWGVTVHNAVRVWRSGIGVDARGNLIYAAANNQTVASLAKILIRAGAVRAMQLDINSYWVSFITYPHPDAGSPSNLLADMNRSASRYLAPDDRDFFAVYAR
ncbi:MAG: phosphodiester glycosidase family protein [Solirubrobacteraceae bacterium]